ncbi:hypothetical protein OS493_028706 [Desmophyllum pertusum]|uniref:diphosphoinositol-polyphosphate diphosphatase n=1 Tax=Desmophyllum pertusum TaxID=174260 RepID=A0A9X0CDC2_9CNID|nr:hypothetical protein OS493_028706 [Desmophyllum pertusum]
MIKNRQNSIRTKDEDGYTRRAGCICFKSEQEEEVLLVSSCRHPGRWVVPSGGVEPGEDSKEAAIREVVEEAGVRGRLGRFLGEFQNDVNQTRTSVYVLIVTEMLEKWEEDRTRSWFKVDIAKDMLNAKPYQQQYLAKACSGRIHNYLLFGALQAVLFPAVNTRLLPFEVTTYWMQHILILVVPFFLVSCQGPFSLEPVWDFTWATLTFTLFSIYMLLVLQPLGMILHVNLNNMVCPAVSDPFHGPYYRIIACCHQPVLIFVIGKIFCVVGHKFVEVLYGRPQPKKVE